MFCFKMNVYSGVKKLLNIGNNLDIKNVQVQKKPVQQQAFGNYVPVMPQYTSVPLTYNYPIQPQIPQNYTKINTVKTPYGDDIHIYMLNNGQKIAIMPKKGTTIVKTFVNSGSMNETDNKRGISHFIEHSLFNGSSKLEAGQLFKEVSAMGAQTNASTNFAQTDYYISSAMMEGADLAKTIEMQADMIQNPKFAPEMIEKEKGPVTSEISMVNDDISLVAINRVVKNLFQINSNAQNLVAGSLGTVNSITRDDVQDYWRRHYTPDNLTTVIVGEVEPDSTMELISRNFNAQGVQNAAASRKSEDLNPTQKAIRADYISPKDNSALVISAFAGPSEGNVKDSVALSMLSLLLLGGSNSRLASKLRNINAYGSMDTQKIGLKSNDPCAISLAIQAPKNTEQRALDILYDTVSDVKTNPVTQDEMTIIKKTMSKAIASDYESSESICDTIGLGIVDGYINEIGNVKNIINSITPQDLMNVAQKYFDLSKVSIGVVHPVGTTQGEILNNYNSGKFAAKAAAATPISFTGSIPFTGKTLDTNDVREMKLADNSYFAINNSNSDLAYFSWKLTSHPSMPKNLAVPYLLAEILNSGTSQKTKEQFSHEAKLKGVDFALDANGFSITANANSLAENAADTVSMLKEAVFNPRFGEQEFERAKKKIADYCSTLGKSASESLIARLYPEFFPTSAQIVEGLKTATLQDVKTHYTDLISNASSNFVITAPIDKNPGLEQVLIDKACANRHVFKNQQTKLNGVYRPKTQSEVLVQTEERNQAQIYKTYSFKMSGNIEDEVKFELLNTILGGSPSSRLFQDLREKQKLAYRVTSKVQNFGDTGILTMFISSTTDDKAQGDVNYNNLQKSIQGFLSHAQALQTQPVTELELENAKKALKQQIFKEMELPDSKTGLLAMNAGLPYGIKRIDEYFKTIDKMTIADIQSAAGHVFSNKPVYSILASPDTISNQLPYLQTLGAIRQG